jgi:YebC/PmpR family DNA-binding regulatory protein
MPKDNIERAIAKGAGADAEASSFETVVYEGYGPDGVAVLVEALTDNRNRTASEVRHAFTKHGGNLGTTGAVAWQFERRGVVLVAADGADEDGVVLAAAEAGADDVELDGSTFVVTSAPESLSDVRRALEAGGFTVESVELAMVPKTTVAVSDESTARRIVRLVEGLEDTEDVQDVYANFDIPEDVLEAVAS